MLPSDTHETDPWTIPSQSFICHEFLIRGLNSVVGSYSGGKRISNLRTGRKANVLGIII